MAHLTDEQIYTLANKILNGEDFTEEEETHADHVLECDECLKLLKCMIAVTAVTDNIGMAILGG